MSSSNRTKTSQQAPQKPDISSFLLMLITFLLLYHYVMPMFFPKPDTEKKQDGTVAEVRQKIENQAAEPLEPAFSQAAGEKTPAEEEIPAATGVETEKPVENGEKTPPGGEIGEIPPEKPETPPPPAEIPAETPEIPEKLVSLGSANPASPYRMLVTLTSRGAAVAVAEMNERRLISMNDAGDFRGGYLGILNLRTPEEDAAAKPGANPMPGCHVDVIGAGTPAETAGLRVGDVIIKLDETEIKSHEKLQEIIVTLPPRREVALKVWRDGEIKTIFVTLTRQPVKVLAPEKDQRDPTIVDPLSFLTTISRFGQQELDSPYEEMGERISKTDARELHKYLNMELPHFHMRSACWEVERQTSDSVTFLHRIPIFGLEVRKTYTLALTPEDQRNNQVYRSYHLTLSVEVRNVGTLRRELAVQQDGPTGLPTEGHWFSSKTARGMFEVIGIRDIIVGFSDTNKPTITSCTNIANGKWGVYEQFRANPITYLGVDAQYFSVIFLPDVSENSTGIKEFTRLRVGAVPDPWVITTNTSCRMRTNVKTLEPGESTQQTFTVFLGPKRPVLLSEYKLDNLVYYGWFSFIAIFLVWVLHLFYFIFGNYGIAIILLTVVVRLAMFPLSKKQVQGSLVMQKLMPEMKKIKEKFEDPMEQYKAQQELYKKYNYNPMSGCWVMFIQLPIFIALYRALLVNVELRQAPLFSDSIRFCSNLAAPDMLFYWTPYVWEVISEGYGIFGLGPYLNLLPILTIIVFLAQQKILMPPAVDDQAKMTQNMMKYMMVFMGFIFFKVPSGLCLYFIVSSLWGLAERQVMPKMDVGMETVPAVVDIPSRPVKKETFFEKAKRLAAGEEAPKQETPMERKKRRKK